MVEIDYLYLNTKKQRANFTGVIAVNWADYLLVILSNFSSKEKMQLKFLTKWNSKASEFYDGD